MSSHTAAVFVNLLKGGIDVKNIKTVNDFYILSTPVNREKIAR